MLEQTPETALLHNIIVGFLIGTICILTVALFILMGPLLWNYTRRTIPVSQKRVDRRYETIERWLISKRIRSHEVDENTSDILSQTPCRFFHDEEAPSPDFVVDASELPACKPPATLLKTHSDLTTPSIETETTEHSHSLDEAVIDDDQSCDPEQGSSTLSTSTLECSICLEPFLRDEVVSWSANVSCGHVFHHQCIKEWLLRRTGCPYCRLPFLSVDSKSSRNFSDKELATMATDWRKRMSKTYYCIKDGLVEVEGKPSPAEKKLISPGVKRDELVKMRATRVSKGQTHLCCAKAS